MEGLIDIYLPDFKYYDNELAKKYSSCDDYFEIAKDAIDEMYRQVGKPIVKNGLMKKGVIVRHLMLPGHLEDSKKIIKYLYDKYKDNIYISIMNQYTPVRKTKYDNLNSKISDKDYDELINYALDLGVKNAFIQEGDTQEESFIPDFDIYDAL
jgi:putative pyruvate formate lyase activating enzyme